MHKSEHRTRNPEIVESSWCDVMGGSRSLYVSVYAVLVEQNGRRYGKHESRKMVALEWDGGDRKIKG